MRENTKVYKQFSCTKLLRENTTYQHNNQDLEVPEQAVVFGQDSYEQTQLLEWQSVE